jgi:integrase
MLANLPFCLEFEAMSRMDCIVLGLGVTLTDKLKRYPSVTRRVPTMGTKKCRISTVRQIENVKPRDERYEIADANLPSNRLVVFPSGARSWVVRYRFGGRTRKMTLDVGATDLARARRLGMDALNAVRAGIDPGQEKLEKKRAGAPLTVVELIDKYAKKHLGKVEDHDTKAVSYSLLRSGGEVERILRKELKSYLKRQADGGISGKEAADLIDVVAERGVVIRNRTLANLKSLFAFAMSSDGGKVATSNPFADLKLKEVADRERVLSETELRAVWIAAGKLGAPYTGIIRLLILTGQRLNEIAGLRWSEINFGKSRIELPGSRTKNGNAHIVALSSAAIQILEEAKDKKIKSDKGLVFTITGSQLNGWSRLRERLYEAVDEALGKKPNDAWVIHDLRRSAATHMAEDLKVAPHVVDKILNHSSGVVRGVAKTYNRSELLDERRDALEAWGSYVEALFNGSTSIAEPLRA